LAEQDLATEAAYQKHARAVALAAAKKAGGLNDEPTPSLHPAVLFLVSKFCYRLVSEKCQGCNKRLIPEDPAKLAGIMEQAKSPPKARGKGLGRNTVSPETELYNRARPELLYCGHWWHFQCLDTALTSPPFKPEGKPCPACGKRIFHRKWTSDIKKLERRWAAMERGKRELDETADFLDLGEKFTRAKIAEPDKLAGFDELF
jgi:hypothetical protein